MSIVSTYSVLYNVYSYYHHVYATVLSFLTEAPVLPLLMRAGLGGVIVSQDWGVSGNPPTTFTG